MLTSHRIARSPDYQSRRLWLPLTRKLLYPVPAAACHVTNSPTRVAQRVTPVLFSGGWSTTSRSEDTWSAPKNMYVILQPLILGYKSNYVICYKCLKHRWSTNYLSVYLAMSARKRRLTYEEDGPGSLPQISRPLDLNAMSRHLKLTSAPSQWRGSVLHSILTERYFAAYFSERGQEQVCLGSIQPYARLCGSLGIWRKQCHPC